jgi:Ca2+-binding EF-hand superfamily protein
MSEVDASRIRSTLVGLFNSFDTDSNGSLSHKELITGLSMLCGAGSRDTNVRRAFNLHDTNSDGSLSIEEFQTYLRSMFNTMMNSDRKTFGESSPLGVNADQLAHATAELAFKEAGIDVNDGGRMSFEQFSRWYVVFELEARELELFSHVHVSITLREYHSHCSFMPQRNHSKSNARMQVRL